MLRLVLLLLLVQLHVHAAIANSDVKDDSTHITISTLHYPPFIYQPSENQAGHGVLVDVINEALDRADLSGEFLFLPWKRALVSAQDGAVDAISPIFFSTDRAAKLDFVETPVSLLEMVLFRKKGSTTPSSFDGTVSSIEGANVIFVRSTKLNEDFDRAKTDGRLASQFTNDAETQLRMIANERADYAVAERNAGLALAKQIGLQDQIVDLAIPISIRPIYIAFAKNERSLELVDRVNTALLNMIKDGKLDEIMLHY